ncbi:DNA-binding response regulator, NarL/FixJ family, contains REC and HTH domains [Amycolatopsis xylanica]|uniref:DNA-binding response regulator, NarL/FixJ family, contains REC and HTH domains n=1 Tax=Amycolatopsis xylanica TaxID=589385 RepID=A0A1H2UHQ3_9PSEU|nr:response regulator transcription factor [Amycolatopsis xylanica]SDW55059.1 DNA-binding response regulator, NarL/FixJ family, contains REC and HTH domains [Amycolatopsis xylanica]
MISVVVADDQTMVRQSFRAALDAQPDIHVVGEAANGLAAIARCAELEPDVVLMDVRMPELDGLEATRRILADRDGTIRVLMLTTFDIDEYVYGALRAGASGFLLKDSPLDDLVTAVRVIAAGNALFAPTVTRRLIAEFAARTTVRSPGTRLAELTSRETEVLRLIAKGLSNTEIADELVIAEQTAKSHVSRVFTKLGVRDRAQAVVAAYEEGLVTPGKSS